MSRFYITTSIAYVNAPPHLGYALEMIQADAIARWHRQHHDDTFFLTGTDEHGAKIARSAQAAGKGEQEFTDQNAEKFRALKKTLALSWDDFIRTSDQTRHWPTVEKLWTALVQAGDIYTKKYRGLYCVGHEAFVTEKDLVDGLCRDHQQKPEVIEEENYFFRLSKYAREIELRIMNKELKIVPETRANEILHFISEGVEDISFSRPRKDLAWGIPVPGDNSQTIYVWADALANYLFPKEWWPANTHCIGKDILRFHALYWPAMLLSAKLPLPKTIFVHGHLTVDGQKMSKTLGNVIDPVALVEKYGVDAVRYYLLREIPPTDDGDFSVAKFEERYTADLANGLGNFVARTLAMASKQLMKEDQFDYARDCEPEMLGKIDAIRVIVDEKMGAYRFHEALGAIWELISFGDAYINEKQPWTTNHENQMNDKVLFNLLVIVEELGKLLRPFLPATAEQIHQSVVWGDGLLTITRPNNLFPRIK